MRFTALITLILFANVAAAAKPHFAAPVIENLALRVVSATTMETQATAQLTLVAQTQEQLSLSLLTDRQGRSAACVKIMEPALLLTDTLEYFHEKGDLRWLSKNIQTLVTMRMLMMCAFTEA
jgi:hypothetical protein